MYLYTYIIYLLHTAICGNMKFSIHLPSEGSLYSSITYLLCPLNESVLYAKRMTAKTNISGPTEYFGKYYFITLCQYKKLGQAQYVRQRFLNYYYMAFVSKKLSTECFQMITSNRDLNAILNIAHRNIGGVLKVFNSDKLNPSHL